MSDVFISYAREDQQQAEWLATLLVERGWSVFWDRTIPPGKTWDEVIGSELDTARAVIVLWSESAVASEWVREEAHEAKGRGVLVPAQLDSARPPFGFRQIQAANLADWKGDAADPRLGELVGALSAILGDASATTAGYAAGESSAPDPGETAPDATELTTQLLLLAGADVDVQLYFVERRLLPTTTSTSEPTPPPVP